MTNQNNDVDVNALIKIYNQKIATLTNQNILFEAKLNTLMQGHIDEKNELLASLKELQEKHDNLLEEIEEDGETSK